MTQAGEVDAEAVRDALQSLSSFPGVTGDVTYEGTDGTPADRVMGFFTYENATYPGEALFDVSTGQDEGMSSDMSGGMTGGETGGN